MCLPPITFNYKWKTIFYYTEACTQNEKRRKEYRERDQEGNNANVAKY